MNFAFPALLILLILLPGVIARYSYSRGSWGWSSPTSMKGVVDEIAYAVFFSIVLHLLWGAAAQLFGCIVRIDLLMHLLAKPDSDGATEAIRNAGENARLFGLYFLSLYVGATLSGYGAHVLVRHFRWDHSTRFLRFNNYWFYLLRGEISCFKESHFSYRHVAGVYLSAVVDCSIGSVLYRGIVYDFTFGKNGDLDTIVITDAHRRMLSRDRSKGLLSDGNPRYYPIVGDLFVLKYADIKTLNLDYLVIEKLAAKAEIT